MSNFLYYGDNLEVMRNKIRDETVDLCYIDPPFNSKRDYFQIYNNIGQEDRAQAKAFTDTWEWGIESRNGYQEIVANLNGRFTRQTVELMKGLRQVLGEGALLAYLVSIALRVTEIHRILKPDGSFYLHCDPTAGHYLKLVVDTIFCARERSGMFRNEIIWSYNKWAVAEKSFSRNHDIILFYSKSSSNSNFNVLLQPRASSTQKRFGNKKIVSGHDETGKRVPSQTLEEDSEGVKMSDVWTLPIIAPSAKERLGYPTQKPEALLERIIGASSNEGDVVMDAYCGCGTTVAVAQRLNRQWIGIDITYQSISLILRRIEFTFGEKIRNEIRLDGIPQDMESVKALIHKQDDRLRKEFEKWAVLTYTDNRAVIYEKKGADKGIDGLAYFLTDKDEYQPVMFQVKSGKVSRETVAKLRGDMVRDGYPMAVLITWEEPTKPMKEEAFAAGVYHHPLFQKDFEVIRLVTVREMVEENQRLDLPLVLEVVKKAKHTADSGEQSELF